MTGSLMPNPYGAPEIEVVEVEEKRASGSDFLLVDVREADELEKAKIGGDNVVFLPLSRLAAEGDAAIPDVLQDKDREIVIICHHGLRSAQVTAWLLRQGWENVVSMNGGIARYAREVDRAVGFY